MGRATSICRMGMSEGICPNCGHGEDDHTWEWFGNAEGPSAPRGSVSIAAAAEVYCRECKGTFNESGFEGVVQKQGSWPS